MCVRQAGIARRTYRIWPPPRDEIRFPSRSSPRKAGPTQASGQAHWIAASRVNEPGEGHPIRPPLQRGCSPHGPGLRLLPVIVMPALVAGIHEHRCAPAISASVTMDCRDEPGNDRCGDVYQAYPGIRCRSIRATLAYISMSNCSRNVPQLQTTDLNCPHRNSSILAYERV
jgi:hypothetical protein